MKEEWNRFSHSIDESLDGFSFLLDKTDGWRLFESCLPVPVPDACDAPFHFSLG